MNCKICNTNETNSTSGFCWKCLNKQNNTPISKEALLLETAKIYLISKIKISPEFCRILLKLKDESLSNI